MLWIIKRECYHKVLSIDAWHDPIRADGTSSSVHVELSFQQGRVGGDDPEFPFTFNIALKRAILTVTVESPLRIDRNSVARQIPSNQGEITNIIDRRRKASASAEFGGKISPESILATAKSAAGYSSEKHQQELMKLVQDVPRIIAMPIPRGPTEYAWDLIPGHQETLDGQPWNPVDEPRFYLRPLEAVDSILPVIKAVVSCKVEDIEITEFELKDARVAAVFAEMVHGRMTKAAAIQHLKLSLRQMNLVAGAFDDRFSHLVIADVLSTE